MQEAIIQDLNLGVLKEKARQLRLDILEMTTWPALGTRPAPSRRLKS
jgi:hypothetical protein